MIDASPVPVVLYNIPKYMHFALPAELVADLAAHDNVIGIKDSSGNRELFASYLASQSDSFAVLTGNAPLFHHALEPGRPAVFSRWRCSRPAAGARRLRRRFPSSDR